MEDIVNILLRPRQIPGHIQSVFIQNVMKLFTRLSSNYLKSQELTKLLKVRQYSLISLVS